MGVIKMKQHDLELPEFSDIRPDGAGLRGSTRPAFMETRDLSRGRLVLKAS